MGFEKNPFIMKYPVEATLLPIKPVEPAYLPNGLGLTCFVAFH